MKSVGSSHYGCKFMEHEESGRLVVNLVRNVKRTDVKTLVVGGTARSLLKEVQEAAANKFRIPLKQLRLFATSGAELVDSNADGIDAQIRLAGTLIVSAGEACVLNRTSEGTSLHGQGCCSRDPERACQEVFDRSCGAEQDSQIQPIQRVL